MGEMLYIMYKSQSSIVDADILPLVNLGQILTLGFNVTVPRLRKGYQAGLFLTEAAILIAEFSM